MRKRIKLLSLFSGIGAFERALEKEGFIIDLVGYSDIDRYASQAYSIIHNVDESLNLGNIEEIDENTLPKNIDMITYGFPCQDISLAGNLQGLETEQGCKTRSGLVWDATRIIGAVQPKVAVAENVKNLVGKRFKEEFKAILDELDSLGYNNYWKVLNARDYGMPQNRERVFIVSIRKDIDTGNFEFPEPRPLFKKVSDYLENDVDLKYYLSQKQIDQILNWKAYQKPLENAKSKNDEYIQTITAKSNTSMNSSMVLIKEDVSVGEWRRDEGLRTYKGDYIGTLRAMSAGGDKVVVEEVSKKEKFVNEIVDRGLVKEGDILNHSYSSDRMSRLETYKPESSDGVSPTLTTRVDTLGVVVYENGVKAVRKLTPREAWRLMGFNDTDHDKVEQAGISDAQRYKMAGNSIVVNVLVYLIDCLYDILNEEE